MKINEILQQPAETLIDCQLSIAKIASAVPPLNEGESYKQKIGLQDETGSININLYRKDPKVLLNNKSLGQQLKVKGAKLSEFKGHKFLMGGLFEVVTYSQGEMPVPTPKLEPDLDTKMINDAIEKKKAEMQGMDMDSLIKRQVALKCACELVANHECYKGLGETGVVNVASDLTDKLEKVILREYKEEIPF